MSTDDVLLTPREAGEILRISERRLLVPRVEVERYAGIEMDAKMARLERLAERLERVASRLESLAGDE